MIKQASVVGRAWVSHVSGRALVVALCLTGPLGATPARHEHDLRATSEQLIYGEDTRQEARAHDSANYRELARRSVFALVRKEHLSTAGESMRFSAPILGETENLCADEPFGDQPVLAECSGVLVDDDLVLTAGHCVDDQAQCDATAFVLDFTLDERGELHIEKNNVFECAELAARELTHFSKPTLYDHALVRLKTPAVPLGQPVLIRTDATVSGEPLVLIGTGLGLPIKIDSSGISVNPRASQLDYFSAQFDLFHRGSGSPVFDARGQLLGIAVRGGVDFDSGGGCVRLRTVPEHSRYAEEASYAASALLSSDPSLNLRWVNSAAEANDDEPSVATGCTLRQGMPPNGRLGDAVSILLAWLGLFQARRFQRATRREHGG